MDVPVALVKMEESVPIHPPALDLHATVPPVGEARLVRPILPMDVPVSLAKMEDNALIHHLVSASLAPVHKDGAETVATSTLWMDAPPIHVPRVPVKIPPIILDTSAPAPTAIRATIVMSPLRPQLRQSSLPHLRDLTQRPVLHQP
jgi:hypothetical protein